MEDASENEVESVLEPIEQEVLTFYGKPLVVIRLADGTPAVVFNHLCENMGLERTAQARRIRRKKSLTKGFFSAHIETPNRGQQVVIVLTLRSVPGWLFGLEPGNVDENKGVDIERYQDECMEVLYQWASTPRLSAPPDLVSEQPIEKPVMPEKGAALEQWREYYQRMAAFTDWQLSIETWRGGVEERLESIEALIPEILERLPETTITPAHQNMVKYYVSQIHKATDKPYATIYSALYTSFQVPTYTSLREDEWDKIEQWLKKQLTKARVNEQPEQGKLL